MAQKLKLSSVLEQDDAQVAMSGFWSGDRVKAPDNWYRPIRRNSGFIQLEFSSCFLLRQYIIWIDFLEEIDWLRA